MQGVSTTGTWVIGATSMTIPFTISGIVVGQYIQATGIPVGAVVSSITGGGLTINWDAAFPATSAGTNATVAFVTLMTVSTTYQGITNLLMGRAVSDANMAEAVRKTVLEYTDNYKFTELQETGPNTQFTVGVPNYVPNYFLQPGSALLKLNKVDSFFIFTDGYASPLSIAYPGNNPGYDITFRTIDRMEVLINTSGLPLHWTRHDGYLWFGCTPDQNYTTYMRYRREHPFPNAGTANAGNDPLFLPDVWQEAVEYGAAARLGRGYNLASKANELTNALKGDEKFQRSDGVEGTPGILFGLTSDELKDQSTTVKRFRIRMGRRS